MCYSRTSGSCPEPGRAINDCLDYSEDAVTRREFIHAALVAGRTLTEIASIRELRSPGKITVHHVVDLLEQYVTALD